MTQVILDHAVIEALQMRGKAIDSALIKAVRGLSELFTVGRERMGFDYLSEPALRRAYLSYFAPVNIAKTYSVLTELPVLPTRPLRVLDLGCGPGVGGLALFQYLSGEYGKDHAGTEVLSIDRNPETLRDAESVWRNLGASGLSSHLPELHVERRDVERRGASASWKRERFDLILVVNTLNELFLSTPDPIDARARLLAQLLECLAPDGSLIVIEPALRETSRALHEVRDRLLAQGTAHVYSPCLHDRVCPALLRRGDWCHEERPWRAPAMIEDIDQAVGFMKDALKFSYVVLRKDCRTIVNRDLDAYRVVSERIIMKGEQRVWLCNETGRQVAGRLDKERSELNAGFDRWERGAIVRVSEIDRGGCVGRIRKTAQAEVIRPVGGNT
jgi:ribosomal protein RSM22 (predicted rRNA methylase)